MINQHRELFPMTIANLREGAFFITLPKGKGQHCNSIIMTQEGKCPWGADDSDAGRELDACC